MVGCKLSGTFQVVEVKRSTTLKGICDLQVHDVFKVSVDIQKHHFGGKNRAVDCKIIIGGNYYNYSMNEVNSIFDKILKIEQIS